MTNYRWEQVYETASGRRLWAIVDDESTSKRSVCSHLLVVNHEWAKSLSTPFQDCELPQRIIALLNADEGHFSRSVSVMRRYKSPDNGYPFSLEGLHDLADQCLSAASGGDSALMEMAGLAIKRLLTDPASVKPADAQ